MAYLKIFQSDDTWVAYKSSNTISLLMATEIKAAALRVLLRLYMCANRAPAVGTRAACLWACSCVHVFVCGKPYEQKDF